MYIHIFILFIWKCLLTSQPANLNVVSNAFSSAYRLNYPMTWVPPHPCPLTGLWSNYVQESTPLPSYIIHPFFSKTPPSVLWYVIYCHFKRHKSVFSASEEWLWSHIPSSSSEQPPVFSFWYSLSTRFLNVPQCSVCLSLPHFSSEHSSSLSQALVSLFLTHTHMVRIIAMTQTEALVPGSFS